MPILAVHQNHLGTLKIAAWAPPQANHPISGEWCLTFIFLKSSPGDSDLQSELRNSRREGRDAINDWMNDGDDS